MKADSYICPSCQRPIPLDDINVSKDLALCRSCGKTSPFSSLCCLDSEVAEPPKRVRVETDFLDGSVKITSTYYSQTFMLVTAAYFLLLIPFLNYTTDARYRMILYSDTTYSHLGIPLVLNLIGCLGIIICLAKMKIIITLRKGEGSVFTGVFNLGKRRSFTCGTGTIVRIEDCIIIQNGKDIYRFGMLLPRPALKYIHSQILRQCFPR